MILCTFNKPFGVLSQFRDSPHGPSLRSYIQDPGLKVAGRLDKDSEGLLLLSDDGRLIHRITQPENKMPKSYWVQVEGQIDAAAVEQLCRGVELNDGWTKPAQVSVIAPPSVWERNPPVRSRLSIPTCWLSVTLYEGRNRQIRRMTAKVGFPTLRIIRYRVGPWYLNTLQPGEQAVRPVPGKLINELNVAGAPSS